MLVPTLARRLRGRRLDFGRWRSRELNATSDTAATWPLDEYVTSIPASDLQDGAAAAVGRGRDALLDLRIFPPGMVQLFADTPNGRAQEGATVIERITFGPIGFEAAVRLVEVEDRSGPSGARFALTWATVVGHPERGIERFAVESMPDGSVVLSIRSRSRPAMLMVRLGTPVARWIQRRYSRAALANLAGAIRGDAIGR